MSDTTDTRGPRVDTDIRPRTDTDICIDPYLVLLPCSTPDPCLTHVNQTLWTAAECEAHNPPLADWCAIYAPANYSACPPPATTTTVVAVGEPPVPSLPATGVTDIGASWALFLVLVGVTLARIARRRQQ